MALCGVGRGRSGVAWFGLGWVETGVVGSGGDGPSDGVVLAVPPLMLADATVVVGCWLLHPWWLVHHWCWLVHDWYWLEKRWCWLVHPLCQMLSEIGAVSLN